MLLFVVVVVVVVVRPSTLQSLFNLKQVHPNAYFCGGYTELGVIRGRRYEVLISPTGKGYVEHRYEET